MGVECCNAGSEENSDKQTLKPRKQSILEQNAPKDNVKLEEENAPKYNVKLEEDEYSYKDEAYNRVRSLDTW